MFDADVFKFNREQCDVILDALDMAREYYNKNDEPAWTKIAEQCYDKFIVYKEENTKAKE